MGNPFRRGTFKPDVVYIAISIEGPGLDPGHIAIMQFIVRGQGPVLPDGAKWIDHEKGLWLREPNEWNVNSEVARSFSQSGGPYAVGWRLLTDDEELPAARDNRNAWRDEGGKIVASTEVKAHDNPAGNR